MSTPPSTTNTTNHATLVEGLQATQPVKRDRHPIWYPPTQKDDKGLLVMNSLTEALEPFAPREGRLVRWYTCGPTVYDVAHMGHARAYLTFDIIRRIMEDYFNYSVIYQMNITDIDDKIIKRARVNELLKEFKAKTLQGSFDTLHTFTEEAVAAAEANLRARQAKLSEPIAAGANSRAKAEREEKLLELQLKQTQLSETREKIAAAVARKDFDALYSAASGVNGDLLDEKEGHHITDQGIFEAHARRYERSFFDDMQRLGIRAPDIVTRVTEYVPQVVQFIEKIMANGFAYRAQSSIFFDTEAYVKAGHDYPKLKPGGERNTTEDEMAEGEGALSKAAEGEKRSPNDFALWKFSKPGEPRWPSPWGEGRPGWHIECSVMASDILGENMDIHSGGWDLKFPHHDNECAQSEAFNGHHQWVNYFLHCGHLHIKGLKMSKSLKNFVTIRQALDELQISPRTMRLLFLANSWHKPMNFSDQSLDEARERERVLRAFFGSVEIVLRGDTWLQPQGATAADRDLLAKWTATEQAVHAALQNNFDTPTALTQLMGLVTYTNQYLLSGERPSATLLRKVGRYLTRLFRIFGVVEGNDEIGLGGGEYATGNHANAAGTSSSGGNTNDRFVAAVDALAKFRDAVRDTAKAHSPAAIAAFLPLCDALRDEWLVNAGIRLEDNPAGPTTWKNDDPALLRREWRERQAQQANERRRKLGNVLEKQRKVVEKWRKCSVEPKDYLRLQDEERPTAERKYRHFDPNTGLPTALRSATEGTPKENDGEAAVSEKELKKLSKELAKYTKQYEEFVEKGGLPWLRKQEDELAALEKELAELNAKELENKEKEDE